MNSSTAPAPEADPPAAHEPPPARWFRRVLPVTALAVALVALAALVSPTVREQLVLSTSRQAQPYVELYFARTPTGTQAVCTRNARSVQVRFTIASHLRDTRNLTYRVSVDPAGRTARTQRERGSVALAPDASRDVRANFPVSRGSDYVVSVRLPGLDQRLRARCDGAGS